MASTAAGVTGPIVIYGRPIKTWSIGVLCAQAGQAVLLAHHDAAEMAAAEAQWQSWRNRAVGAHRLSGGESERLAGLMRWEVCTPGAAPVGRASLAIAMVVDDQDVDQVMELEHRLPPTRIFAVASLVAPIGGLLHRADHPERVLGLHFMHPAHKMRAVELITTPATGPDYAEAATELCRKELGLFVLCCEDHPGFVVNRVHLAYLAAAMRVQDEMGLEPDDVDQMLTLSLGVPVGPFRLMRAIGYDNIRATLKIMEDAYGETYRATGLVTGDSTVSSVATSAALGGQEREGYRVQTV